MWERITQDTFTLILTYISPSETLLTIRRVCKTWKKLSEHSLLWKEYYTSYWKNMYRVHVEDWEKLYKEATLANKWFFKGHCSLIDLRGHSQGTETLQFEEDTIISGGRDCHLCKWSISKKNYLYKVKAHDATITCLQFNRDIIITCAEDYKVKFWRKDNLSLLHYLVVPQKPYSLQFNDSFLVIGGCNKLFVYDMKKPNYNLVSEISGNPLNQLSKSSGGLKVQFDDLKIVCGGEKTLCIFDFGGLLKHDFKPNFSVTCFQYNTERLVCGSLGGSFYIYEIIGGTLITTLKCAMAANITCLQFDQTKLVAGTYSGAIVIHNMNPDPKLQRYYNLDIGSHNDSVYCLQFYGSRIISAGGDKRILVWDFNPNTFQNQPLPKSSLRMGENTLTPNQKKKQNNDCTIS